MEASKLPATPGSPTACLGRLGSPGAARRGRDPRGGARHHRHAIIQTGGLIGFGLLGLFVGPVVLAVAYTVLSAWVAEQDSGPNAAAATTAATESPATAL